MEWTDNIFDHMIDSYSCTSEEITQKHYDYGNLYICPPENKLYLKNNYLIYPNRVTGF
jgi:hypothetical protein